MKGISLIEVYKALFKRGNFDFITVTEAGKHEKQAEALEILTNQDTEEFLYGGAAGGAKSWTGCAWLLFMCLCYPETKWFIGREELKRITQSTLITFFKVAKAYGASNEFVFNAQKNVIVFKNGSLIDLLELKYLPRDREYERFGSTEYTGGWVEEGGEINYGAYEILKTRIGRHYNKKYKIRAKIFITCNPKKNWLYHEFYKPYIKGGLRKGLVMFLQAFVQSNPFIDEDYIERLKRTKDKSKRERLLKGNWDYDDNPYSLCEYDNILAVFENDHLVDSGDYYITADIARFGSDKAVIGVWNGWKLIHIKSFEVSATTDIQAAIQALRVKYQIPKMNCIADEDGVGGGVVDNCGIKGFVNNSKPFKEVITDKYEETPNYQNLQQQCLFALAKKINKKELFISADVSSVVKEAILEELSTIVRDPKKTPKLATINKEQIKADIGRSPDYRDMIFMRMYFEYDGGSNEMRFI